MSQLFTPCPWPPSRPFPRNLSLRDIEAILRETYPAYAVMCDNLDMLPAELAEHVVKNQTDHGHAQPEDWLRIARAAESMLERIPVSMRDRKAWLAPGWRH